MRKKNSNSWQLGFLMVFVLSLMMISSSVFAFDNSNDFTGISNGTSEITEADLDRVLADYAKSRGINVEDIIRVNTGEELLLPIFNENPRERFGNFIGSNHSFNSDKSRLQLRVWTIGTSHVTIELDAIVVDRMGIRPDYRRIALSPIMDTSNSYFFSQVGPIFQVIVTATYRNPSGSWVSYTREYRP